MQRKGWEARMTETYSMSEAQLRSASASMQDTRNYLRQVRSAYRRVDALTARVERYRELATRATGRTDAIRLSGTTNRSKVENYVLELVDTHELLRREIKDLLALSREAEQWIGMLENDHHRTVLQFRYLCGMDWEEVAEEMHFSLRWVHQLHHEAVAALQARMVARKH